MQMAIRFDEDTIEMPPPLISGWGFHFDRTRRVVTMRQRFLWWRLLEKDVPFSDISDIRLGIHIVHSGSYMGSGNMTSSWYSIDMIIDSRGIQPARKFELLRHIGDRPKTMRILADMRRFVGMRAAPQPPVREDLTKNCAQCGKRLWASGPDPVLCTQCSHSR
jgi:hypothetical protein